MFVALGWLGMGCGSVASDAPDTSSPVSTAATTELHVLDVPRPDGDVEQIYAHVGVPVGDGPHPVVVYAHGQGLEAAFNCAEGPPADGVSDHAALVAKGLAEQGWLTVAPLFRNRGDTAPLLGALRPRDHHLLDASAVLAAAHFGVEHPAGGGPVGLVGMSMGSFPVVWAGSTEPALGPLADGLDLRVVISGGMLGDHVANLGRVRSAFDAEEELARAEAITQATAGAVQQMSFPRGVDPIDDVGFADDLLTPAGQSLAELGLLRAAPDDVEACEGLVGAPICATDCFVEVFYDVLDTQPLDPATFLTPLALEALDHWERTAGADPGADTSHPILAELRRASPSYGLPGARTARWVSVLAEEDRVVSEQLLVGDHPRRRWLDALEATGVPVADVRIVDPACGHDDYLLPSYGGCGFDTVRAELAAALED